MRKRFDWKNNPEIVKYCIELRNELFSYAEISNKVAERFKCVISEENIRGKLRKERKKGKIIYTQSERNHQSQRQRTPEHLLESELEQWKRRYRKLSAQVENTANYFISLIGDLKFREVPVLVRSSTKMKTQQEFHGMISDWHYGLKVKPDATMGLGSFNQDIARKRLALLAERIIHFKYEDKKNHGLDKLVLFNLGDMGEGFALRPGMAYFLDRTVVEQLIDLVDIKRHFIQTLAPHFTLIEEFCVEGNHGRLTQRTGEMPPTNNFDYMLNRIVQKLMAKQKNYVSYVSESPRMLIKCGNYNFCLSHGEQVRSWMGTPYYGVERDFWKITTMTGVRIDYGLYGHFHIQSNLGDMKLINGNLVGGTEYTISQLSVTSIPSQKIWYFHPEHGINREINVRLDERKILEPDEKGIFTPYTMEKNIEKN